MEPEQSLNPLPKEQPPLDPSKRRHPLLYKLFSRFYDTIEISMSTYFGYLNHTELIPFLIREEIPLPIKIAGFGMALYADLVCGAGIADGVASFITGEHHFLGSKLVGILDRKILPSLNRNSKA